MTDEWIKIMVHIYNGILAIKKNKIIPFTATWIDLEIIILNEASHKEKDKYPNMVWYHLYVESKKNDTNELIYKTKRLTNIENKFIVT